MDQYDEQPLEDFVSYSRRNLLDLLEATYGDTEPWPLVRSRVLQIFGRSGFGRYANSKPKEKRNEMVQTPNG